MDNRKHLNIPDNFAFIIRSGGANLRYSEFKVSYAIAVGGAKQIALIGHNHCGMVNLVARRTTFIEGLMNNAGWTKEQAEEHFMNFAPMFEEIRCSSPRAILNPPVNPWPILDPMFWLLFASRFINSPTSRII